MADPRATNPTPTSKRALEEQYCHADRDGECSWRYCPQLRDGEPERSGCHCPLDKDEADD